MIFVNKQACDLYSWALQHKNRIKASKLSRVALDMEKKYRAFYGDNGVGCVPHSVPLNSVTAPTKKQEVAYGKWYKKPNT